MKHDAILAKNEIAKELADAQSTGELGMCKVSTTVILNALRTIEAYLEPSNQPSVDDIVA